MQKYTQTNLKKDIARELDITIKQSEIIVNKVFDLLTTKIVNGDMVKIKNFAVFNKYESNMNSALLGNFTCFKIKTKISETIKKLCNNKGNNEKCLKLEIKKR